MASFLKTVSATFATGMLCGAGALIALAPAPVSGTREPGISRPDTSRPIVSATAVPCKDQVWPITDRRCMRWTAEGWTAGNAAANGGGTEPNDTAKTELAAVRAAAEEQRAAAKAAGPKQDSPVESVGAAHPTRTSARHGQAAEAKRSAQSEHRTKTAHKTQVARSRYRDREDRGYRDDWGRQDYGYRAYQAEGYRERRRMTGGWRNDASSDFFRFR